MPSGRSATGGLPGFRLFDAWAEMLTAQWAAQTRQVNATWDKLRAGDDYPFRDWARDLATMWERTYSAAEDLMFLPFRFQQQDRPTWVSLVWNREAGKEPDTVQDEISLPVRVLGDEEPASTNLERLGPDSGAPILSANVVPRLSPDGARLTVTIKGLCKARPALEAGHYVGFVTLPSSPRPIAIVFLAITEKSGPRKA
jgi:hypothetical protein